MDIFNADFQINFQEETFSIFFGIRVVCVTFLENLPKRFSSFLIFNCLLSTTMYLIILINLHFPAVMYIKATKIYSGRWHTVVAFAVPMPQCKVALKCEVCGVKKKKSTNFICIKTTKPQSEISWFYISKNYTQELFL